jgi:hypothetical protein
MDLILNEHTYVLPKESNKYLSEVLPPSDPLRITWEVLSDEEKECYLVSALRRLEEMHFIGSKVSYWQPLKFPRIAEGIPTNFDEAPIEIKRAQVVIAVDIVREELYLKRRNVDACTALGITSKNNVAESLGIAKKINSLLHRWITNWRRV